MHFVLVPVYLLLITPITYSWWAAGSQVVMDPYKICQKSRKLKGKVADICKNQPDLLKQIAKGYKMGQEECQHQFRHRRWNCTTAKRSMKKVLLRDTRETGFVNALTAAGTAYAITRACTMGQLPQCACDRPLKRNRKLKTKGTGLEPIGIQESTGDWEWGGCGDNINYGILKSKEFMDSRYKKLSDMKTLVKLHNYAAGRLAIKKHMVTDCKCHGLSGSCTLRTCWRKMSPFRKVGDRLKERFDGAAKVVAGNDGRSFQPEGDTIKPPAREDLVYSEESPGYCSANTSLGSLGTEDRRCSADSLAEEGCDIMCCGRGFHTLHFSVNVTCNCKFRWCCEVTCDKCEQRRDESVCL